MKYKILYLSVLLVYIITSTTYARVMFRWRYVDYSFPNDSIRNNSLANGAYIPYNNMPLGIQAWRDKIFITVPRWKFGVVSTLNFVWTNDTSESPLLIPYPSWEATRMESETGIVNIVRTKVDECNRLWAVDLGIDSISSNSKVIRPSRLIAIDLITDKIVRSYQLKVGHVKAASFFANLDIDTDRTSCENTYAYIADPGANALIVYDYARNDSWRFEHNFFHFDPLQGHYDAGGFNYQRRDGIIGLALTNRRMSGYKTLFFHPLSSTTEFAVSTRVLRNKTMAMAGNYYSFRIVGFKGLATNGPVMRMDPITQIAYFPLVRQNAVGCWHTEKALSPTQSFRVVWRNERQLDYPNDIAITPDAQLCALSDRLPTLLFGRYNSNQFNFYVTCQSLVGLTIACA